jgi:hypothetical protein
MFNTGYTSLQYTPYNMFQGWSDFFPHEDNWIDIEEGAFDLRYIL